MDKDVKISGRHVEKDGTLYLSFSGGFVEFEFNGNVLDAEIVTDKADDPNLMGYAGVFVNGDFVKKIKLDRQKGIYRIYEAGEAKKAVIRLMRFSENNFGKMGIVNITGDGKINPTSDKNLKIEFVGDSITCGYGVEAKNEFETFRTETENPAKAYAVLTAEALNADYEIVSWSGNGLLTQWIPPERDEPLVGVPLMPDMYRLEDYGGYRFMGFDEPREYDFSKFAPDIVVVNLGTNDASYTRNVPERVERYGKAFNDFLKFIRSKRPNAKIVACLGVMNTDLCDEAEKQVKLLNKTDKNIWFLRQSLQDDADGKGADWHPSEVTQRKTAVQLTDFLRNI